MTTPVEPGLPSFLPLLHPADLALYTGRPVASYPVYTDEALNQSVLLFQIATCLTGWPTDPIEAALARYAVLSMADSLVLAQPYQAIKASPFQNESIGSYSYSKMQQSIARMGTMIKTETPTGLVWFDLAVERLGICEIGTGVYSGSIGVFEDDAFFRDDTAIQQEGHAKKHLLGPADVEPLNVPFIYNSDRPGGMR